MSDELERLVQSARRHVSHPSPAQREDIKHAVLSGAAVGGGASIITLLVTGLALVALGAAGVVGALRYVDSTAQPAREQPRTPPLHLAPPTQRATDDATLAANVLPDAPTTVAPEASHDAPTPDARLAEPTGRKPRSTPSTTPRAQAPTTAPAADAEDAQPSQLQLELTLIGEATDSLEAGHLEGADEALRRYDAEVSGGLLATEADVLKVLVLCGTGQPDEARALASELRQQAAGNPALARLRGSCATP